MIQMGNLYPIRRWKNNKKLEPEVILVLNTSATMVLNPHGIY